jgi:tetratricopeptide (TPR) repeat protein
LYITGFLLGPPATAVFSQPAAQDPDALYANREDLDAARQAARIWAARLADTPDDFTSAWKLARARYWLGGHSARDLVKGEYEAGVEAARHAIARRPDRPEGHFWLAANLGGLAETQGRMTGLRLRKEIRRSLERVLALDPAFQDGSADRALGRWYLKVPGWFGGSRSKAEEHLRRSLEYDPHSTASLFFLAETLVDDDREDEARDVLHRLAAAPVNPLWAPEDREFKRKGQRLLESLPPRSR